VLDLILPLECGGCGAPSTRWCEACAIELDVKPDEPHVVNPRIDPEVPVFALGRYAGARRRAILAMKENGRGDLAAPLARALAVGVHRLLTWGMIETPLTIVPAPTRRSAARRRGGDPVTRLARAAVAGHPDIDVTPAFVDDVVTTGATARESVRTLRAAGVRVAAVLAIAAA
jgi:predicted amidophosphoribosyltransferase